MESLVERTRRNCRAAGTVFVDVWDVVNINGSSGDSSERSLMQQYPLALASLPQQHHQPLQHHYAPTLVPRSSTTSVGSIVRDLGAETSALLTAVKNLFQPSTAAPLPAPSPASPSWHLIDPAVGITSAEICQGALGDCWFLSAVAVLAHRHSHLIEALLVNKELNPEGVFGVRLWHGGIWRCVVVGATFPSTHHGQNFAFARNRSGTALWVTVLEKAFAHARGGYARIVGGRPRDALLALTGMPCVFIPVGGGASGERDDDDRFAKLASYVDAQCIVCACCGGTSETDAVASRLGLQLNHAYSVLAVGNHPVTKERVIALRNPWGRSQYLGMHKPPVGLLPSSAPTSAGLNDGTFWMEFSTFAQCFTEADVCLTRTYQTNISVTGLRIRGAGRSTAGDAAWDAFSISQETALRHTRFTVLEGCEVHVLAVQAAAEESGCVSPGVGGEMQPFAPTKSSSSTAHTDVSLIILRLSRRGLRGSTISDVWELHGAPPSCSCDSVVCHTTHCPPGDYCVVPMSVSGTYDVGGTRRGTSANDFVLNLTILSESQNIVTPTQTEALPPFPPLSQILYECLRRSPSYSTKTLCGDALRVAFGTCGHLNIVVVENGGGGVDLGAAAAQGPLRGGHRFSSVADVTVDCSGSSGVSLATAAPLAGCTRWEALSEGYAAVAALAAPAPHGGSFRTQFRYNTSAKVSSFPHVSGVAKVIQGLFGTSTASSAEVDGPLWKPFLLRPA